MDNNFYLNIKKIIPESVKGYFRPLYHKFNTKIDKDILYFLEKYYNLSERKIRNLLENGGRLSADFWFCYNPITEGDIIKYYEDNPFYVFNLIFWHSTKYQKKLRDKFVELAKGKVLDYGGGVGDLCASISKRGLLVDYADLQGRVFNFAKKFFDSKKLRINMINLSKDDISYNYDTIFCIDVIEHVTDPKNLLKKFVNHLNPGGYLVVTALEPNISEDAPMHFRFDFNPEEYLNLLGMEKGKEHFLWIKR